MSLFNKVMNKTKQTIKDKAPGVIQQQAKAKLGINIPQINPGNIDINIKGPTIPQNATIGINIPGAAINPGKIEINGPSIAIDQKIQQYSIPESAHDHPLILDEHLMGECMICRINVGGQAGYKCGECGVTLCFNCSNRIFYGNKQKGAHPQHPLALTSRKSNWRCDICKNKFFGGASFYCKLCDFDACDRCYLAEGYPEGFLPPQPGFIPQPNASQPGFIPQPNAPQPGYNPQPNVPQPEFNPQSGYPPQSGYQPQPPMGYSSQPGYPSQPQPGFPPQSGYPFQPGPNFPPQPQSGFPPQNPTNYSQQQDSETVKRLNETIKSYEIKIKNLETENINLRQSNMDERSKLQATIDSLQQQLAAKEGIIKTLESEKNSFFHKNQQYEGDMNRMRIDLTNITKEKEFIVKGKDEEIKKLGFQFDDLTKKYNYLEGQFKIKENELGQINGQMIEERKKMQFQIDSLNNQLIASQNQLKDIEYLRITIKKYEDFLNKLKFDITQFQNSCPPLTISKVHP